MRGVLVLALVSLVCFSSVLADDSCPCSDGQNGICSSAPVGGPCPCDPDCASSNNDCPCNTDGSCNVMLDGSGNQCPCDLDCSTSTNCPSEEMKETERQKCIDSGGSPVEQTDSAGCVFISCNQCPSADERDFFRNECLQNGGSPYEVINNGCVFIECKDGNEDCPCGDGANNNCPLSPMGTDCLCDPDCSTVCLSESELQVKEKDCLTRAGISTRVTVGNCVDIDCKIQQTSTECACSDGQNNVCSMNLMRDGPCCCDPDCSSKEACKLISTACPSEEMKKQERERCAQSGGVSKEVKRSDGCVYIECDMMNGMDCPCADGSNNNCPIVEDGSPCCCDMDCSSKEECKLISTGCPSEEMKSTEREKCMKNGGTPFEKTNPNGCVFISCDYIPSGCFKTVDIKGMEIIKCETANMTQCPDDKMLADKKLRCVESGGFPEFFKDNLGCSYVNCRFDSNKTNLLIKTECPNETEVNYALSKCKSLGLIGKIAFENGCKIAKCVEKKMTYCPEVMDPGIKEKIVRDCESTGGKVITAFDEQGCPITKCESQDYCLTVPKEAISECEKFGGQMVTKADDTGCITYFKCVQRGESQSSYIDPVTEVPSATKLLQVSLALETLIMKLDELARQTAGIANYYESVGSSDALRFRTVSGMFLGVISKVNVIKQGIRDNLSNMSTSYLEQVKHDIQYIKDVVLMDIVYVMLSTGEDFSVPETANECSDFQCFENSYRICKPVSYFDGELTFNIKGVSDGSCIVEVSNGESSMTCKRSDYAFGFNNELDVSSYCEGSLVSVINNE